MAAVQHIRLAYNNVYAVSEGPETALVDTGPDYRGAFETLLGELRNRLPAVVVATHGHPDHAGLGAAWLRRGVPVLLDSNDRHFSRAQGLADPAEFALLEQFVRASGAPAGVQDDAMAALRRRRVANQLAAEDYPPPGRPPHWPTGLRFEPFVPSPGEPGGAPFPAGLRILPAPGHTPGNVVLTHEAEGWLFSGDTLLPEITPTPAIQGDPANPGTRLRSLPAFVESLKVLAAGAYTRCFPGHGEPFDDVAEAIRLNLDAIDQRTARVRDELRTGGPSTPWGLSERIYPRAVHRRFWQIVPTILGHLDILEEVGEVTFAGGDYSING
jgi:glyoxylase-like metal-dependent hydrolase (beta-lactamase superfamily II)